MKYANRITPMQTTFRFIDKTTNISKTPFTHSESFIRKFIIYAPKRIPCTIFCLKLR